MEDSPTDTPIQSPASEPERAAVVPLRPCLGLLAIAALAVAMTPTAGLMHAGVYTRMTIVAVLAAGALALTACTLRPREWRPRHLLGRLAVVGVALALVAHAAFLATDPKCETAPAALGFVAVTALLVAGWVGLRGPSASVPTALLGALALGLSGEAVFFPKVNADYIAEAVTLVRFAAVAGFGLTASLVVYHTLPAGRGRWLFGGQVSLLFTAGAVLRFAAAVATPDPWIDVYYAQQESADHLLAGENPYSADSIYVGSPYYPPLPLLVGVPVRAVGLDVRVGIAACDLVAALALLAAARSRGGWLTAGLLAAAYLHFPRVPLLMEMAWYEPMLAALLGTGLLLAARGWWLGHFLLGLGITGKQYGVVCLPALVKSFQGRRRASLLGVIVAGAVTVLPFFLWNPPAFFDRVVAHHLRQAVRDDGLTLQALARDAFGVVIPSPILPVAAILLIGWITWRTPTKGAGPAPWMATSLLVFCLCHRQAFINYYYLVQYLMLLGMADWFCRDLDGTPHSGRSGKPSGVG